MDALNAAVLLFALAVGPAAACDEACAPGFVFDDALATCVRVATS
jgi:hypothetical protein